MFTKLWFLNDSQPSERSRSVTLIRRLVRNKLASCVSAPTCIHLVLPSYAALYLRRKIQHDMRVSFALLNGGLIFLSFPQQPQSRSGQHASCDRGPPQYIKLNKPISYSSSAFSPLPRCAFMVCWPFKVTRGQSVGAASGKWPWTDKT